MKNWFLNIRLWCVSLRLRYLIWRMPAYVRAVLKTGSVREIRGLADKLRKLGDEFNCSEMKAVACDLDSKAEKLILRRVFY